MPSVVSSFRNELRDGGLFNAMRWLNAGVPYRDSAIFAFRGDMLQNICLVDKADPAVTTCGDQEITQSYCLYVSRSRSAFGVDDAMLDRRVDGHPKQRSFQSYYGVPLVDDDGKLMGTVCHFDTSAMKTPASVAEALDELAPFITRAAF